MALAGVDDRAVDDVNLRLPVRFHVLQHGGARADRLLEQVDDRLPTLRIVEVDPLRRGDRDNLSEQPSHERDRPFDAG